MSEAPRRNTAPARDPAHRTHFLWEEFDRLPRMMRDLINFAPCNVGTGFVYRQIMDGSPVQAVARQAVGRWRRYAQREALLLYGPTHPQVEIHADA